ncbi:hypothetical protein SKAU_G00315640 [Synaphobranchus kaupii]|uniref:Uncharacterized protein n=1 Tax=Synaphobranchus kaupii TaxID=118154 RepID=A0A9Q1ESI1_SYNKA|nr:hypothetical protein SKAU_G00315640 [Synaphobranchus kaupii]
MHMVLDFTWATSRVLPLVMSKMFNWVVKVVPHPPATPGNLAEEEKPSQPSSAPVSAQGGIVTWISSGFAYALPQPAGANRLSRANSEAKEDNVVDRQGSGLIGWIVQGLGKVVPQPDDKYKEDTEPAADAEENTVVQNICICQQPGQLVVEEVEEGWETEQQEKPQDPHEESIEPPKVLSTLEEEMEMQTEATMVTPEDSQEQLEAGNGEVKLDSQAEESAQPVEDQALQLAEESIQNEEDQGAKLAEESIQNEEDQGTKLAEESIQNEEDQALQLAEESIHNEEDQGAKLAEESIHNEEDQGAKLAEESVHNEEDQALQLAEESIQNEEDQDQAAKLAEEVAHKASSGEQLANIQEEEIKEVFEYLEDMDPVEGTVSPPLLVSTKTEPKVPEPKEAEPENATKRDSLAQVSTSVVKPEPCVVTKQPEPTKEVHPTSPIAQDDETVDDGCGVPCSLLPPVPNSCIAVRNWLMQMPHTSACLANFNQLLQNNTITLPKMPSRPSLGLMCKNLPHLPHLPPQFSQLPQRVQQYYLNILNSFKTQQET